MNNNPHDRNIDLSNVDVFGTKVLSILFKVDNPVPIEMLPIEMLLIQSVFNELKNVNDQDYGDIIPN
jgi:hypothetical protein